MYLFPIQGALFPFIGKAYDEDGQENENSDETGRTYVLQRNSPRQQESQERRKDQGGDLLK